MSNQLSGLRVLISGAGVAGPALACRLADAGAETTVVEVAPRLRTSGFAVDFRGPTHLGVLRATRRARRAAGGADPRRRDADCVDEPAGRSSSCPPSSPAATSRSAAAT